MTCCKDHPSPGEGQQALSCGLAEAPTRVLPDQVAEGTWSEYLAE